MAMHQHLIVVVVLFTISLVTSSTAADAVQSESAEARRTMRIGGERLHPIREKMQATVSFAAEEVTVSGFVTHCAAAGGFVARLNTESATVQDLERISEIPVELRDVTIEAALDHVLHPYGLDWVLRRDDLLVTTQSDVIDNYLQVAVFDVTPLIRAGIDGDAIVDTVQNCTAGPWFDLDGIGGRIGEHDSLLFVRQTPRQMELTEQLLETMRSSIAGDLVHGSREVRMKTGHRESIVPIGIPEQLNSLPPIDPALFTKVYDVRDLQQYGLFLEPDAVRSPTIKMPVDSSEYAWDGKSALNRREYGFFDPFLDILEQVTNGPWFNLDGMGGLDNYSGAAVLVVRQTTEMHREVESLLDDVRTAFSDREPPEPLDVNRIETHIYRIDGEVDSPENVVEAITTFIAPETWEDDNPETGIMVLGEVFVVRNTHAVRIQIEQLLIEAGVWAGFAY